MNLKDIDASLTFGFYCRDEDDLDSLCEGIENINQSLGGYPVVSVAEDRQHYDSQNAWDQDDDDEGCLASSHDSDEESRAPLAQSQSDGSESDAGFAPLAVSRSDSHSEVEDCAPLAASSLVVSVEEPKLPPSQ